MPRLKYFNIRERRSPRYDLNKLIGVHFNQTNDTLHLTAYPREAKFTFENAYEEEAGTNPSARWFRDLNLTSSTGSIIFPFAAAATNLSLCLNTLRSNYNPSAAAYVGQDVVDQNVAPYGTADRDWETNRTSG